MERYISLLGLFCMVGFAWLLSAHRRRFPWRIVGGGMALQFVLGLLVLKTNQGQIVFRNLGVFFQRMLDFVDEGCLMVFGDSFRDHFIAFQILPTIIFFSALMSILYYLGIVQFLVRGVALIMQHTLGTSGAESLSTAANIFVGQTEAPLVIRPYISSMTQSELMAVMVGGFATVAGGVLAAYIGMGVNASHLLTASVISAPAALLIAKIMQPEVDESKTMGTVSIEIEQDATNLIEAAGNGALVGLQLALNVGAILIAFVAIVAMINAMVGFTGIQIGEACSALGIEGVGQDWSLERVFAIIFYPFAWLMGIPAAECGIAGELLGTKMVLNEFIAYDNLGKIIAADAAIADGSARQLSERGVTILTYALCGFANFSSIGIQLGGIGGIAPDRKTDLARLGFRAMLGGTLAAFMTACVAGILL